MVYRAIARVWPVAFACLSLGLAVQSVGSQGDDDTQSLELRINALLHEYNAQAYQLSQEWGVGELPSISLPQDGIQRRGGAAHATARGQGARVTVRLEVSGAAGRLRLPESDRLLFALIARMAMERFPDLVLCELEIALRDLDQSARLSVSPSERHLLDASPQTFWSAVDKSGEEQLWEPVEALTVAAAPDAAAAPKPSRPRQADPRTAPHTPPLLAVARSTATATRLSPSPPLAGPSQGATRSAMPSATPSPTLLLSIQQLLHACDYLPERGVDGHPGPTTTDAIKKYQSEKSMKLDGEATAELLANLRSFCSPEALAANARNAAAAAQRPTPAPAADPNLVREVQKLLAGCPPPPGEPRYLDQDDARDGLVGPRTQEAIRRFQVSAQVPQTGQPSGELLRTLRSRCLQPR